MSVCPCDASKTYAECCQPFHQRQALPASAEQLMRSRYSAYVLKNAAYLAYSQHPKKHKPRELAELPAYFEQVSWQGLEILTSSQGQAEDQIGKVEFKAFYRIQGRNEVMHEHSRFRRYQGRWVYWDGQG